MRGETDPRTRRGRVDIAPWLQRLGSQQYEQTFQRNDIDGDVLLELTAEDFDWSRRDLN